MTFRTPRAAPKRRRTSQQQEQRQQILVTVGFAGLVVVSLLILVGTVGASYYGDHLAAIATVNGVSISKDQWRDQQAVDQFRINATLAALQSDVAAGVVDQTTASQEQQSLQQAQQSLPQNAASELIDGVLQSQLAKQVAVTVTQADVDQQLQKQATSPELRKVLAIFVAPGASPAAQPSPSAAASAPAASSSPNASAAPSASASSSAAPSAASSPAPAPSSSVASSAASSAGPSAGASSAPAASAAPSAAPSPSPSSSPTPAQKAEAQSRADAALAALQAGKPFDQVAKEYSTDPSASSGGDYGYLTATSSAVDQAWLTALFKLPLNGLTDVVQGADGTYRIGKVTDIVAAKTNPDYQKSIESAGVNYAAYRQAIYNELLAQKLQDAITKQATTGNIDQVHAWEIEVATTDSQGNQISAAQVKASHILFSPKGDPSKASSVPASDPSWNAAKQKADAVAAQLRAISDPTKRAAEFATLAKSDSNDTSSGANGGDLGWFTQDQMVPEFSTPLFSGTHQPDEIIGPVKSQFGYHVILFVASRPSPQQRVEDIEKALSGPGASFSEIAKANSDAADASSGGDMGWVAPLQLDQSIETVLFSLKPGEVSATQTQSGGIYLYEISQKEARKVDASQLSTLQGSAFANWYAAQKAKADIWQSPDIAAATPPAS